MNDLESKGITIGDLLNAIQGEILNCPEKSEMVVESLMVGAMCVDPAPQYFSIKQNKAVITRGDRTDIQLGALETSIQCLVLTGGKGPAPIVLQRAEEKGVPVVVVEDDTPNTLAKLEKGLGHLVSRPQMPENGTPESNE